MTTLAESFLADLDDLSDDSDREPNNQQEEEDEADEVRTKEQQTLKRQVQASPSLTALTGLLMQMLVDDVEKLNYDSLENVAHLKASEKYQDIMQVSFEHVCAALSQKAFSDKDCNSTILRQSNIVHSNPAVLKNIRNDAESQRRFRR